MAKKLDIAGALSEGFNNNNQNNIYIAPSPAPAVAPETAKIKEEYIKPYSVSCTAKDLKAIEEIQNYIKEQIPIDQRASFGAAKVFRLALRHVAEHLDEELLKSYREMRNL